MNISGNDSIQRRGQVIEEIERLHVYEMWPELPVKLQQWILRRVNQRASILACPAKGLEVPGTGTSSGLTASAAAVTSPGRNQAATLEAISPSSSAAMGIEPNTPNTSES